MLNRYKLNKVAYTIVIITTNGHVYFTDVNDSIFLVYNYSNLRCLSKALRTFQKIICLYLFHVNFSMGA